MPNSIPIKIWDPLIRLGHWALVFSFILCYFTQVEEYELHLDAGYVLLSIVFIRIIWGFIGTRYARFSSFLVSPTHFFKYISQLFRTSSKRYVGHNPAGGYMTIALLINLLVICISGIALDAAENRAGPLSDSDLFMYLDVVQDTHIISTDVCLVLIFLHLSGVIFSSLKHKENLIWSMLTGFKRR